MQQLTLSRLQQSAKQQDDVIIFNLPVPANPARAQQFIKQLGTVLGVQPQSPEWGADRLQVTFSDNDTRFLLCIEWLCDAIWIENAGGVTYDIEQLWNWLKAK